MKIKLKTVAGTLSFAYAVSSAKGDYLEFYIDGTRKGRWQGEIVWAQVTIPVTEGLHTFTWQYIKNAGGVAGQDRAWVDEIFLPMQPDSVF